MRVQEAVRWLAFCRTCTAGFGEWCRTPTGRNHPSRVSAAIEQALYDLAWPQNESARIRERERRRRAKAAGDLAGFARLEPATRVGVATYGRGVKPTGPKGSKVGAQARCTVRILGPTRCVGPIPKTDPRVVLVDGGRGSGAGRAQVRGTGTDCSAVAAAAARARVSAARLLGIGPEPSGPPVRWVNFDAAVAPRRDRALCPARLGALRLTGIALDLGWVPALSALGLGAVSL